MSKCYFAFCTVFHYDIILFWINFWFKYLKLNIKNKQIILKNVSYF